MVDDPCLIKVESKDGKMQGNQHRRHDPIQKSLKIERKDGPSSFHMRAYCRTVQARTWVQRPVVRGADLETDWVERVRREA
jgi:hypothetical protein